MALRIFLLLIIVVHGLIHLMGFVKAFHLARLDQLSRDIAPLTGLAWLTACLFFLATALMFIWQREDWWIVGMLAVVISQVLIFLAWSDARFGSVANLIILLVALPAAGKQQFDRRTGLEHRQIEESALHGQLSVPEVQPLDHLPVVVQKWLRRSGASTTGTAVYGSLKQAGKMRTKPGGKWLPFTAEQSFNLRQPAFVWHTTVRMLPGIYLLGRDKFQDGQGQMNINLLALFKVAGEGPSKKINTATMIRYISELCWFPAAARHPYLTWEEAGVNAARVSMEFQGTRASGVFRFSADGDVLSFEASRYYSQEGNATLEDWFIDVLEYRTFAGYRIPSRSRVTWKLAAGDFTWLQLEITDLETNTR